MQHPDYPFWSFLGLIAVLLPTPWHWRARNIATLSLIGWIFLANGIVFINTLVWADNYVDWAPVWCDISGRIILATGFAVPACSLAQMQRLESVASARSTMFTARQRTQRMWCELAACIGFPILMLPVLYCVQGHRYDIVESIGCSIPYYPSWLGIVLRYGVQLAISMASLVYAVLAVRHFLIRRLQFRSILANSNSGLNVSRYLRLIALAVSDVTILVTVDMLGLLISVYAGEIGSRHNALEPIGSWDNVHENFSLISQLPETFLADSAMGAAVFGLYCGPMYAFVFFIFFGLGEEAIAEYVRVWGKIWGCLERAGFVARNTSPRLDHIPSLGSKVVPVSTADETWSGQPELASFPTGDKHHRLFQGSEIEETDFGARKGIPILVERTVV